MRYSSIILALLTYSASTLCAQSENSWPKPGAVWRYCSWDIKTFAYTRDSIVDEKLYSVVEWIGAGDSPLEPGQFFYGAFDANEFTTLYRTSGDTIYRRVNDMDYIFMVEGIEEGESFETFRTADVEWNEFSCQEYIDLTVSEVEIIDISENPYREVTLITEWPNGNEEAFSFIESIGPRYQFQYILDGMGSGVSADLWDCLFTLGEINFVGYLSEYFDDEMSSEISLPIIVHNGQTPSCFLNVVPTQKNTTDMLLRPNPARQQFHIEYKHTAPLQHVALYDMHGRLLRSWHAGQGPFNLEGFPAGIYVVRASARDALYTQKLIVEP